MIEDIPTTTSYNWERAGRSSVKCSGSSCSSYFLPASGGTAAVQGAILKLLLPDGRIVIAACIAKADIATNLLSAMAGDVTSTIYRSCRRPPEVTSLDAEFSGNAVKLFMQEPSIDGRGRRYSETYYIRGVLQPTATPITVPQQGAPGSLKKEMARSDERSAESSSRSATRFVDEDLTEEERTQRIKSGRASRCTIVTSPPGAGIYIDGTLAGESPTSFVLIQRERYRDITIQMSGYRPFERGVWPNGENLQITVTLEPDGRAEGGN
ncbi:MAG: PEGA domain-containing protein [Terracidiphilus sp.]